MITHWTKQEVIDTLTDLSFSGAGPVRPPQDAIEMIMYVERLFYNKHVADIHARRDKLKKMWVDRSGFLSFWNAWDETCDSVITRISPGCYACLFGAISHVRHSYKCTQSCDFCYYASSQSSMSAKPIGKGLYCFNASDMSFTLEEAKVLIARQARKLGAIGWLQKEPLEELESLEPLMKYIAERGIHQYLYTNGVKAHEGVLEKLAEWGLNEIRFNLQATDFNPYVIESLGLASDLIEWTLIETPIYSKSYDNFVKHKEAILYTGVDQINLPELQVCAPDLVEYFEETEGPVYKHRRAYVSPISSRHYAYDLIELAEKEDWDVVINDCSNDTKFYRGSQADMPLGAVNYPSGFELAMQNVLYLADQVLEDGVTYEFF